MPLLQTSSREEVAQADRLAAMVAQAFPALPLGNRRLEQSGGDHLLLIVDDRIAFRFPREGMHDLDLEISVLRRLQERCSVATPAYRYVDPAGRFAGYPMIDGLALTPARYAALAAERQHRLLAQAAEFLACLHGLSPEAAAPLEQWPIVETPAEYASHAVAQYLPIVATRMPGQAGPLEAFYTRFRALEPPQRVVVHGDLVDEHMLLDARTGQLAGIIDFSDVALGDPAEDLLGFWAYGADAVRSVIALYRPSGCKDCLFARSHDHFIRYRLGRIFDTLDDADFDPDFAAAQIDALLSTGADIPAQPD